VFEGMSMKDHPPFSSFFLFMLFLSFSFFSFQALLVPLSSPLFCFPDFTLLFPERFSVLCVVLCFFFYLWYS